MASHSAKLQKKIAQQVGYCGFWCPGVELNQGLRYLTHIHSFTTPLKIIRFYLRLLTASLNALPAVNLTVLAAGILISAPV